MIIRQESWKRKYDHSNIDYTGLILVILDSETRNLSGFPPTTCVTTYNLAIIFWID